jgi:acetyl-CoA acetyltransferase
MGIGPVPAVRKLVERLGLAVSDFDVIELNEAFASQGLAVLRELGLADDAPQVNPNGGAIALGHPLGMSGARMVLTALHQLEKTGGKQRSGNHVCGRRPRSGVGYRTGLIELQLKLNDCCLSRSAYCGCGVTCCKVCLIATKT